ncbi:MAG: MATE family efflux transporter [Erysipelotrichaceae bacterium]|nr:MATE family efflux transporter [Erysipelotrichaceae bacterium]
MTQKNDMNRYENMSVSNAILTNAIPAIAAMLMILIYNLADTFFVGKTNDPIQIASVALTTPVFLIYSALGTVFGMGGTSVISRAFGEGRRDYARKVSSFCMWGCVFAGTLTSVLLVVFLRPLLTAMGASEDVYPYASSYLRIAALCGPFSLISNCFTNVLRAEGQSSKAMMGQLIGNLLNVILDPILILSMKMGVVGAAVATVIGNLVAAGYYLLHFWSGKSTLSISLKDFTLGEKVFTSVLAIGIPACLGQLLMSISQMVVNGMMASYGDLAVAGYGVATKANMIVSTFALGLGQGVAPLLGYSFGSGNREKLLEYLKYSLIYSLILGVVCQAICYLGSSAIINAFLSSRESEEFIRGLHFFKILMVTDFLFGVYYVLVNCLQAMGKSLASFIVNASRQGLIYIPLAIMLNGLLKEDGLAYAQPISDIISTLMTILLTVIALRQYKKLKQAA